MNLLTVKQTVNPKMKSKVMKVVLTLMKIEILMHKKKNFFFLEKGRKSYSNDELLFKEKNIFSELNSFYLNIRGEALSEKSIFTKKGGR